MNLLIIKPKWLAKISILAEKFPLVMHKISMRLIFELMRMTDFNHCLCVGDFTGFNLWRRKKKFQNERKIILFLIDLENYC